MIPRTPKKPPIFQRVFGAIVIIEAVAFGASYFTWQKANNSREYREELKQSAPWLLDIYYKMGELLNDSNKSIRENDETIWKYNAAKNESVAKK